MLSLLYVHLAPPPGKAQERRELWCRASDLVLSPSRPCWEAAGGLGAVGGGWGGGGGEGPETGTGGERSGITDSGLQTLDRLWPGTQETCMPVEGSGGVQTPSLAKLQELCFRDVEHQGNPRPLMTAPWRKVDLTGSLKGVSKKGVQ